MRPRVLRPRINFLLNSLSTAQLHCAAPLQVPA
jgi:hypothetical protein